MFFFKGTFLLEECFFARRALLLKSHFSSQKAFFNHLKTGAAPPKHGHIFMHPWISRSPRWVRGKIARTIAAKASIAAKIDAFEGTPLTQEDIDLIDKKIDEIKAANPRPNKR